MVNTIKFSEFVNAGDLDSGDLVVGLDGGENASFTVPQPQLLPPGTTAQQPASPNNGDLRLNTDLNQYEFWSAASAMWIQLS